MPAECPATSGLVLVGSRDYGERRVSEGTITTDAPSEASRTIYGCRAVVARSAADDKLALFAPPGTLIVQTPFCVGCCLSSAGLTLCRLLPE